MEKIAPHITEKRVFENGRIFAAPTGAKDVVSFEGSVNGGYRLLPHAQTQAAGLAGQLFDAGTKAHGKDALRESLATRGAGLSFSSGADRTYFSGSCLPEDLPFVLQLAAECLGTAVFPASEIAAAKERTLGDLKESKTSTRAQAANGLARELYDPKHVNYAERDSFIEKSTKEVERKDLTKFRSLLGTGGLVLAIAGDIDISVALKSAEKAFGNLGKGSLDVPAKRKNLKTPMAVEKNIFIPNRPNIDVFFGAALALTYSDRLYIPFMVLSNMLGGGGASHLFQTVRERDGLTYGVYAWPFGFQKDTEGAFRIFATFAPQLFSKGVETIRKEARTFFATGLTEDMLQKSKDEMAGSYVIKLATTRGIAGQLHSIGIREKDLSHIDSYIDEIRNVTVADIKEAAALVPLDKLAVVAAGTFAT